MFQQIYSAIEKWRRNYKIQLSRSEQRCKSPLFSCIIFIVLTTGVGEMVLHVKRAANLYYKKCQEDRVSEGAYTSPSHRARFLPKDRNAMKATGALPLHILSKELLNLSL